MASSMLAITAPSYTDPSGYQLSTLPRPVISEPTDVLFRVHAASINPVDVKKAAGILKLAVKERFVDRPMALPSSCALADLIEHSFPYQIGYDCAGVVTEIGKDVKSIKIGDEVFSRLPEASRGAWSEYAKCPEHYVALKPKNLSFEDAASSPLAGMTALQTLSRYQGLLAGKTVFVPAGLSGTGALIVSVSTQPSGTQLQQSSVMKRPDNPRLPWFGRLFLDIFDTYRRTRARRWGVAYEYLFLDPNAKDLETLASHAEQGKVTPVVGCTVNLKDVDDVKAACGTVYNGKGGIGKTVIRVG
ncbi:putative alcohol dehydrogenase [Colletotrichum kahawae]|uniref:Alcohol dehydrogenase n=1 Tax=Colletotrichum kahawae TaxID=34407 RepID=A0AAE0CYY3_COLKA|nr:putative alcohol dehydrogenase [Colletotrichum kahawae]